MDDKLGVKIEVGDDVAYVYPGYGRGYHIAVGTVERLTGLSIMINNGKKVIQKSSAKVIKLNHK